MHPLMAVAEHFNVHGERIPEGEGSDGCRESEKVLQNGGNVVTRVRQSDEKDGRDLDMWEFIKKF